MSIFDTLSGMFGWSGRPYDKARDEYKKYMNKGLDEYAPYANAGRNALGNYQNFLNPMQDPNKYFNDIMSKYQESPYAHFQQNEAMNAGNNAASASGMLGSTAHSNANMAMSRNLSSQDMQQYLQNILGIGNTYMGGQQNLMNQGFNAAGARANMYQGGAQYMGDTKGSAAAANQKSLIEGLSGIGDMQNYGKSQSPWMNPDTNSFWS